MFLYIMICIIFVSKYLEKFANYEKKTSFFSAAPGGLGPLVMLAEHEKSDISQVATSHLIRLIVIITAFLSICEFVLKVFHQYSFRYKVRVL